VGLDIAMTGVLRFELEGKVLDHRHNLEHRTK